MFERFILLDVLLDMKTLFTFMIFLMFLGLNAQELYTVTGTIQMVSYSQGGMELPPSEMMPQPLPNKHLYVVQYFGTKEKSIIITKFTSDKNGNYEVQLPPGKYGFIQDKSELKRGVFLPGMNDNKSNEDEILQDFAHHDYWELNTLQAFEVTNIDMSNVNLTHYSISICYTCP